jgi:arsenite-transporting ATPase
LAEATHFLFFTGKGGVGKTSLSAATALALSDGGKSVLLVSTDAASNLDEMLGVALQDKPTPVQGASGLSVMIIDPDIAAESYRRSVLDKMEPGASDAERSAVREQLSGACTTEIAAFDEFSALLGRETGGYDHVVFDTAPTGHTLRLRSLPKAWTGFLEGNDRGASCLGPHSGLKMQERSFQAALGALGDGARTTVVLVTRPESRGHRRGRPHVGGIARCGPRQSASGDQRRIPCDRPARSGCAFDRSIGASGACGTARAACRLAARRGAVARLRYGRTAGVARTVRT